MSAILAVAHCEVYLYGSGVVFGCVKMYGDDEDPNTNLMDGLVGLSLTSGFYLILTIRDIGSIVEQVKPHTKIQIRCT